MTEDPENERKRVVVCCHDYSSYLGDALLKAYPKAEYVMMINPARKSASLRSRVGDNMDVAKIAEFKGGGGHKNAAGYRLDEKSLKEALSYL